MLAFAGLPAVVSQQVSAGLKQGDSVILVLSVVVPDDMICTTRICLPDCSARVFVAPGSS